MSTMMTTTTNPADVPDIPYAAPMPRVRNPVWVGAIILGAGVIMVVLAGCFLLGAVRVVMWSRHTGNSQDAVLLSLLAMLYLCCLMSFGAAGVLLTKGTRSLLRVAA